MAEGYSVDKCELMCIVPVMNFHQNSSKTQIDTQLLQEINYINSIRHFRIYKTFIVGGL